jgi:DNA adenine methylase
MIGGLNPIIGRIGGKTLLKKKIISMFPDNYENMIYAEPFVGGGSIFFYKNLSKKEIINDIDKNLIDVYKLFKKYDVDDIFKALSVLKKNKETFNYIKNEYKPKTEFSKGIRLYYLLKMAFFNDIDRGFGLSEKLKNKNFSDRHIRDYSYRLKNTIILNKDYSDIIKKYDSVNTFFYLDPPYENSKGLYDNYDISIYDIYNILKNIKGRFLLSYNNSAIAKELFKNYKIKYLKTKYTDPIKGGHPTIYKTEIIISNY